GMENPEIETGNFEIQAEKLEILNPAEALPINIETDGYEISEDVRMKYRYLDLRRSRLQKNLRTRAEIIKFIRDFLTEKDFVEIETPILSKSTPEGARDYLVPSRLQAEKFYALPQSPQQYKQLLMVACFEQYFQIAKCFRDEDTRGDRQPEFTQLDLEMSFVEREDILKLMEEMTVFLIKTVFPKKTISKIPFPVLTYKEAMEKYGSDKPDLRKDKNNPDEMAFAWIVDFPVFEKDKKTGKLTYSHNPFTAPKSKFNEDLMNGRNLEKLVSQQYDLVLNGFEIAGGGIRINKLELLEKVFEIIGYSKKQIGKDFGHILEAFKLGAPPHGGIAFGLDRLLAILQNEPNIREVIAFSKTGDGRDLMMDAPSEVDE
ncbi:MAG: amino acid--tRNA ligase-related protein, partial [Patescibacteria group bacterium]